ncbi:MAG TPA: hypothetical protein VHB79_23470 [Polyangiaceae bacterium]|nr:hypothetical protein [Polyangiaceae bacterium]
MKKRVFSALVAAALGCLEPRAFAQAAVSADAKQAAPAAPSVGFAPPPNPLRLETQGASIQLGLLAQPQFEMAGAPDADYTTKNLFLRRIRFMVGGSLLDRFDYFFDTDYPDLFKVDPANQSGGTGKNAPGLNVQDAFVTFRPLGNLIKVDGGFMLPPLSHNALQGAGTLYGYDYFVNSFRRNVLSNLDPFGSSGQSPNGRDAGVQLRGLVLGDHLEYRLGVFQGVRVGPVPAMGMGAGTVAGNNFFRVAARLQVNVLDAEPGYFYQGSYLGTKKILSVGAFYDFEDQYKSRGFDALVDLPLGPGVVTAQANFVQWDGGNFILTLPKATAIMAEAGYLIAPIMLSPIVRIEKLTFDQPTAVAPNETRYGGGLAFWPYGHTSNIKAFFAKVQRDPAPHGFNQINLQWQVYFY